MKRADAEKLLGGYATGTLTEAERTALFTAALEHQSIFDALMEEEALRELLADPAAKAQLLVALAPAAPKVVPFWRRPGLLSAAAGLLMASLAGLVYLRSPEKQPPPLKPEAAKTAPVPAQPQTPPPAAPKAPEGARKVNTETPRPSQPAPPTPVAAAQAVVEVLASQAPTPAREAQDQAKEEAVKKELSLRVARLPGSAPGGVIGGIAGGVVGGVVGGVQSRPPAAPPPPITARLAETQSTGGAHPPTWTLEPAPGGITRITVMASRNALLALLKRSPTGVESLSLAPQEASGEIIPWRIQIRLAPGDVLDLYQLNHPAADPSMLPESGPVDGFRARIHPAR